MSYTRRTHGHQAWQVTAAATDFPAWLTYYFDKERWAASWLNWRGAWEFTNAHRVAVLAPVGYMLVLEADPVKPYLRALALNDFFAQYCDTEAEHNTTIELAETRGELAAARILLVSMSEQLGSVALVATEAQQAVLEAAYQYCLDTNNATHPEVPDLGQHDGDDNDVSGFTAAAIAGVREPRLPQRYICTSASAEPGRDPSEADKS